MLTVYKEQPTFRWGRATYVNRWTRRRRDCCLFYFMLYLLYRFFRILWHSDKSTDPTKAVVCKMAWKHRYLTRSMLCTSALPLVIALLRVLIQSLSFSQRQQHVCILGDDLLSVLKVISPYVIIFTINFNLALTSANIVV